MTENLNDVPIDYREYSRDKAFAFVLAGIFLLITGQNSANNTRLRLEKINVTLR